jgi:hypothetical protein
MKLEKTVKANTGLKKKKRKKRERMGEAQRKYYKKEKRKKDDAFHISPFSCGFYLKS